MKRSDSWHIGILIPARNEEALIGRCLCSVLNAIQHVRDQATADVIVVADTCTDRTSPIAAGHLKNQGLVRNISVGSVGMARRMAASLLLERYQGSRSSCWFANTDADCTVPTEWLSDQLTFAKQGVEAIAGIISVDSFAEHAPEVAARFESSYRIEADGSHPHIHGANFGVRADSYLRAGGWHDLDTAEDHDLWRRLSRTGANLLSTSKLHVETSGRRTGRAPHGFAEALSRHNGTAA